MPHDPADRSPLAAAAEALLKAMQAGGYIDGRIYNDVGRVEAALFADAAWRARAEAADVLVKAYIAMHGPMAGQKTLHRTPADWGEKAAMHERLSDAWRRYEEVVDG